MFDGSCLKMGTVMLLFCLLMMKHNLTGAAMHDIFSIVSFILPIGNILCSSFSEFKTLFSALYCLTKISIRAKHSISRVFSLFIFIFPAPFPCLSLSFQPLFLVYLYLSSPFFVHCPYKGRINQAESVLIGLKAY